jgi:hypothetical protein
VQEAATYTVAVSTPAGLDVKVTARKLEFTRSVRKLAFQVTFSRSRYDGDGDGKGAPCRAP